MDANSFIATNMTFVNNRNEKEMDPYFKQILINSFKSEPVGLLIEAVSKNTSRNLNHKGPRNFEEYIYIGKEKHFSGFFSINM